jgi:hypothetical protein
MVLYGYSAILAGMAVGGFFFTINLRSATMESFAGGPLRSFNENLHTWFGERNLTQVKSKAKLSSKRLRAT